MPPPDDAKPVTFDVTDPVATRVAGHPIRVVLDGAAVVRWVRASLAADGGKGASDVPRTMLRAALDGKIAVTDPDRRRPSRPDAGDCLGLLPHCDGINFRRSVFDPVSGRGHAPTDPASSVMASIDDRPAYADVFAPSPLLAPCGIWSVGASDPTPSRSQGR